MVAEAIADQQKIGKHLMLRGFLSSIWRQAIDHHTKVRINSKSTLLVSSFWKTYFFPIWNQRNLLLHKEGSYVMQQEHETLNETLRMVKHNHRKLIHYTQYHLVDYTEDHIS